jgi:hypothetical protein
MRTAQSVGFGSGDDHIYTRMCALAPVRWGFLSICVVLKTPFAGSFGIMTSRA